jgi:glycosyltransferase involved in cell wall biosynthesis
MLVRVPSDNPLRVLVAHNRYRSASPSGENQAVADEIELLRCSGHSVRTLILDSDEIPRLSLPGKMAVAAGPLVNPYGLAALRTELRSGIDVMHLHNPYPLLSPWAIRTSVAHGIPVVQTVHNYRLSCMAATLRRDGSDCFDCVGRLPWPGLVHGCYRGSRLQSAAMTVGLTAHRRTWPLVSAFLALTPYMAEHLLTVGIRREQIRLRPTWSRDAGPPVPPGEDVLFAGRLVSEKGLLELLDAWDSRPWPGRLRIAGDGPLRSVAEDFARRRTDCDFLGPLDQNDLSREYQRAALVVIPSQWPEGQPRVLIEALNHGRPVVASNLGSLASSVEDAFGWKCDPDAQGLARALSRALADRSVLQRKALAARERYSDQHSPASAIDSLLAVYEDVRGDEREP